MGDPAERAAWLHANVDSDLQYIWQESGIGEQVQYDLGQHYRTVKRFSSLADDRAGLRQALTDDFQMRPDSAANRASIAAVVSAWEASKFSHEEEIKLRQEAKSLGAPRPLPHTDRTAMLRALERNQGNEIGEREQPSMDYIALLLEEIEQDEPQAHALDEITSRRDSQTQQLQSSLDQSGRVRITRQKQKGKLPTNTEELRTKLRLETNAWLMVASKMRNKIYLRNLERKHFDKYVEYLLGEKCYNMRVPTATGEKASLQPPWHILLDYEYEMRSFAFKKARKEGMELGAALELATTNSELKELHFTSPVTFAFLQRPAKFGRWDSGQPSASNPNVQGQHKGQPGKGKGGKGKKGKGGRAYQSTFLPGTKLELVTHTADGQEICYKYNMRGKKCDGKCGRVHVCRVKGCLQPHSAADHPTDS